LKNVRSRLGLAVRVWITAVAALTVTTAHADAAGPKPIGASSTYPIYISKTGSYVLTGNLVLPKAGTRGIVIQKPDVTIDFNGFTLASPTGGHEPGIYANSAAIDAVVKNGTVTGFGGDGVLLGDYSTVQNMHVERSGGDGIHAGSGSSINSCLSHDNGGFGISFSDNTGSYTNDVVLDNRAVLLRMARHPVGTSAMPV